jgi:glycosyl hydrolase family 123
MGARAEPHTASLDRQPCARRAPAGPTLIVAHLKGPLTIRSAILGALLVGACTNQEATTPSPSTAKVAVETREPAGGTAPFIVWVLDPLTRVQPADAPGTATAASVKAARGEYEAFQVVIRAPDDAPLRDTTVTMSSLVGPGEIPPSRVALYREHYVQVTKPSPGSPYPAGWWPDALVPLVNPETGQPLAGRIPASPFVVPAGQNQPVWVEVHVLRDTSPGAYGGTLTVSAEGGRRVEIPVKLQVWNFALPRVPALRTHFGQMDVPGREASPETSRRYLHELVRHRISPSVGWSHLVVHDDGSIDTSRSHAGVAEFLAEASTTTIPFQQEAYPFRDQLGADRVRTQRYFREVQTYLEANGWLERAVLYLYDEPDTPEKQRVAQTYGRLVREAAPGLRTMVTTPIRSDFYGLVRLWVPPFDRYDFGAARARQARGEEVWTYTAGVRGGRGYPTWLLDYPLIQYRVAPWINWSVGASGLLYWATGYWRESSDPWTIPTTYGVLNGDGALVYPGGAVGYAGPVASMRLKALRDGIEDYDYLELLKQLDAQTAAGAARAVGATFKRWTRDPADIYAARERLGERLDALASRSGPGAGSAPPGRSP